MKQIVTIKKSLSCLVAIFLLISLTSCVSETGGNLVPMIEKGNTKGVEELFKSIDQVNTKNENGKYPLHIAIETEQPSIPIIEKLLEVGADYNAKDNEGKTPLFVALEQGKKEIVVILVKAGASLYVKANDGKRPIDIVSEKSMWDSVIFENTVDLKDEESRETILHIAVKSLSKDAVNKVLALEPNVNAKDSKEQTAIDLAFSMIDKIDAVSIAEQLIKNGASYQGEEFDYFVKTVNSTNPTKLKFPEGNSTLHEAVNKNHLGILSFFLTKKFAVDAVNIKGATPIHDAIRLRNKEAVQILLKNNANPNIADTAGNAPVHIALDSNLTTDLLDLLLSSHVNLSVKDLKQNTALHLAVEYGYPVSVINTLLDNNAPIDAVNNTGNTALHIAMINKNYEVVSTLTKRSANIFFRNSDNDSPLFIALADGNELLKVLLENGSKEIHDDYGDSVFHYAIRQIIAKKAPVSSLNILYELGFDPSSQNNIGDTALHISVKENDSETGLALLAINADPLAANNNNKSPLSIALSEFEKPLDWFFTEDVIASKDSSGNGTLHSAALAGIANRMDFIISKNKDVNILNNNKQTALMLAVSNNSIKSTEKLLSYGAETTLRDVTGSMAIHYAAETASFDCLRILAQKDQALNQEDNSRKTPLHRAIDAVCKIESNGANPEKEEQYRKVVAFLLENGADPLSADNSGETALHSCAKIKDERFTLALLSRSKIVDVRDTTGTTPLLKAVREGNTKVIEVLIKAGASIFAKDVNGDTPLLYSLKYNTEYLEQLLTKKTTNKHDSDGNSAIMIIIENRPDATLVEKAIQRGASPNDRNSAGFSLLHIALQKRENDIVKTLIKAGADPFYMDFNENAAITIALQGEEETIKAVIGDNPNIFDSEGNTALHYAAGRGYAKAANILLSLGANNKLRNSNGETARDVAERNNFPELANLLK